MKKNLIALAIMLGSTSATTVFAEELIEHRVTGPKDKRINILMVGDGFTAAERGKFLQGVASFHNALMVDSWGAYTNYFNTYAIFKASEQSGATRDDGSTVRNTAFGCGHSATMARLITCNSKPITDVRMRLLPETDLVVVISNSPKYGGSGGGFSVASISAPQIVAHEVGHSFAGLADEYSSSGGKPRESNNTTANILERTQIKWAHWIDGTTPLKTPDTPMYHNTVGAFEGAAYMATGWYRPTYRSRMRTNGAPNGPVNDEQFVLAMYKRISPIESYAPANTALVPWRGQGTLSVQPMRPDRHSLNVEWWVNGVRTFETGNTFQGSNLPYSGTATVTAKVIDRTAYVRKDSANLLDDEISWTIQVGQAAATPAPTIAPAVTPTPRPTATATPKPVATATPRPTATVAPVVTATPRPTATVAPVVTATPRPTATATPVVTITPRPAATATPAVTATPRPTATSAPVVTATPAPAKCASAYDARKKYIVGDMVSISSKNYLYVGLSYATWRDLGKCKP